MLAIWTASAGLVWPLIEYGVVWSIVRSVWGVVCYNLVCPAPFPGIYWALYHPAMPVLNNQPFKWIIMIFHQLFNSLTTYLIGIPYRSIQIIHNRCKVFFYRTYGCIRSCCVLFTTTQTKLMIITLKNFPNNISSPPLGILSYWCQRCATIMQEVINMIVVTTFMFFIP